MRHRLLTAVAWGTALIGCSYAGDGAGVVGDVDASPSWVCIRDVVEHTGVVTIAKESTDSTGRRLTLHGLAPPGTVQSLVYTSEGIAYALQVISEPGLPVQYKHYSIFPRDGASADALTHSLSAITNVAARVEAECHVAALTQRVRKFCHAKACPKWPSVA
jgi:hypothetical protein